MPKALKSCPKSNKSPNLVTLLPIHISKVLNQIRSWVPNTSISNSLLTKFILPSRLYLIRVSLFCFCLTFLPLPFSVSVSLSLSLTFCSQGHCNLLFVTFSFTASDDLLLLLFWTIAVVVDVLYDFCCYCFGWLLFLF